MPGARIRGPVIGVAVGLAAAAAVFMWMRRPPKPKRVVATTPAAAPTEVVLSGRAAPRVIVGVNAPIAGTLDAFFVDTGAEVIEGQLLGRVRSPKGDSGLQQAQSDLEATQARLTELNGQVLAARLEASRADAEASRARGDLDRLQKAYQRQKGLWEAGATARLTFEKSEREYNDAKSASEKLETAAKEASARLDEVNREIESLNRAMSEKSAAIERAKQETNTGELHSPADGIVIARHGQPGDMVDPSMKLMDIATELTKLQATVTASPQMRAGQAAIVHLGDEEIAGTVQEIRNLEAIVYFDAAMPIHQLEMPVQVKIKF